MPNLYCLPDSFPDLSRARVISVDIETRDDDLEKKGPGVRRGAYIIGVSIAADHDFCEYYPVAHDGGPNLNKKAVFKWLKGELNRAPQVKLGANLLYDFDFLAEQGIQVKGPWYDVQLAEPLLDENNAGNYNLGALAKKYLGEAKAETELEAYCTEHGWKGKVQKHLWEIPPELVARYAKQDVRLPIKIFEKQKPILRAEELWDLFLLETRLSPLLLQMRRVGVRVDEAKLNHAIVEYKKRLKRTYAELKKLVGFKINYQAAEDIAKAFDKFKVKYPLTAKTKKPSFTKDWLKAHEHPLPGLITACRTLDKFIGTFLKGSIKDQLINGRVHCLFNQLLSDEYGTVTGRFSASHPNLQFIPARDEELGLLCRSMFIPEEECYWGKADYCLTGETKLITEYGPMPISKIIKALPGVLSSDKAQKLSFNKITHGALIGVCPVYKMTLENGSSVKCTKDHKWMSYDGKLIELKKLKPGDKLAYVKTGRSGRYPTWYIKNSLNHKIRSIEFIGLKPVYQITVKKDHTYVLENGLISSNSQVEFRIFAHYAIGSGSDNFRAQYVKNPKTDYHQWCADTANKPRRKAKDINFGLIYGMGLTKLAKQLGLPYTEAEKFLKEYNEKIPFMKTTLQAASNVALSRGYVKTILNRRRRFIAWTPVDYALARELDVTRNKSLMISLVNKKIKEALDKAEIPPRPGVQRAYVHKALNAIIQGSAADLMKKAMVDCYEAGLYNILFPHLTVHDELDNSVPKTKEGEEAFHEQIHIMETAIKFKVPIIVDYVLAKNWGKVE